MDETKFLSLLGLCRRAGKIRLGADLVCDAIRRGDAKLVILASDASENTKKKISNCTGFYGKRLFFCGTDKDTLGSRLGREGAVSCAAVCDEGFSALLEKHIDVTAKDRQPQNK